MLPINGVTLQPHPLVCECCGNKAEDFRTSYIQQLETKLALLEKQFQKDTHKSEINSVLAESASSNASKPLKKKRAF